MSLSVSKNVEIKNYSETKCYNPSYNPALVYFTNPYIRSPLLHVLVFFPNLPEAVIGFGELLYIKKNTPTLLTFPQLGTPDIDLYRIKRVGLSILD